MNYSSPLAMMLQIFSSETVGKPCNKCQLLLKYCKKNPMKKSMKILTLKKQLVIVLLPFL